MDAPPPVKRAAIVGTAQSWVQTPWDDHGLYIVCLNDAYSMGIPRFDCWMDLHPFDKMIFRPRDQTSVDARALPHGTYVRPAGHIEWLQTQAASGKDVIVQSVPDGWPATAQRFPIEQVLPFLQARGDAPGYVGSSPELILAYLILQGYTEIHIYGIHLATQAEYIKQRPSFEWVIGKASAMGITFILPTTCPLLKHSHIYGYEPEPEPLAMAQQQRLALLVQARAAVQMELIQWPRWKSKVVKLARLRELDAKVHDVQQQIQRAHVYAA